MLRDKYTTLGSGAHFPLAGEHGQALSAERRSLEGDLRDLQKEVGHGHPSALVLELQLADCLYSLGELSLAREAFEEVMAYRSVLFGEHSLATARVARSLFRLLCEQDDRPAMAEVYYRFLSWIPMRDPATLCEGLREVLREVETLLAKTT